MFNPDAIPDSLEKIANEVVKASPSFIDNCAAFMAAPLDGLNIIMMGQKGKRPSRGEHWKLPFLMRLVSEKTECDFINHIMCGSKASSFGRNERTEDYCAIVCHELAGILGGSEVLGLLVNSVKAVVQHHLCTPDHAEQAAHVEVRKGLNMYQMPLQRARPSHDWGKGVSLKLPAMRQHFADRWPKYGPTGTEPDAEFSEKFHITAGAAAMLATAKDMGQAMEGLVAAILQLTPGDRGIDVAAFSKGGRVSERPEFITFCKQDRKRRVDRLRNCGLLFDDDVEDEI